LLTPDVLGRAEHGTREIAGSRVRRADRALARRAAVRRATEERVADARGHQQIAGQGQATDDQRPLHAEPPREPDQEPYGNPAASARARAALSAVLVVLRS